MDSTDLRTGGKARSLLWVRRLGFAVPDWIVILPGLCPSEDGSGSFAVSDGEREALERDLQALAGAGARRAVRSSALSEDGNAASFAGQLESFLDVPTDAVAERVGQVWRSGFTERVRAYRRQSGLPGEPEMPAVIVQRMVDAEWAGVVFSIDPLTRQRRSIIVSAVSGLGESLVSGEATGFAWKLAKDGSLLEAPPGATSIPPELLPQLVGVANAVEQSCSELWISNGPELTHK
ncbi:MAG: PEP/pyruvate-binding domain-containing protein [Opitutales bacterium]